jgi:hypothetical protein
VSFDFSTASRSFFAGKRVTTDGAFWACMGTWAAMLGLPAVPAHRLGLDWPRCFHSLGVALGQHALRRLELQVAQQAWATSPIARRIEQESAAVHDAMDAKERALDEHDYGGKEPVDPAQITGLEDWIP